MAAESRAPRRSARRAAFLPSSLRGNRLPSHFRGCIAPAGVRSLSPMNAAPRLLDTTQAAESLGLSARTLESYRRSGRGPRYVKIGSRALYAPEDLAAWVEARKRSRTVEELVGGEAV